MLMAPNVRTIRAVLVGVLIGFSLSVITEYFTETTTYTVLQRPKFFNNILSNAKNDDLSVVNEKYAQVLQSVVIPQKTLENDVTEKINFNDIFPAQAVQPDQIHAGESNLSDAIRESVRISCFVITQPANHKERALTVRATWGKRCNVLYFVSTENVTFPPSDNITQWDPDPPIVTAIYPGDESRSILFGKSKLGFQFAYDNYFDDADWFVKADDDTFMIMENLRFFLMNKDPSHPAFYGCKFKVIVKQGYMSGGAGYVLSKEALKRFAEQGRYKTDTCRQDDDGSEDVEIGRCLEGVGVEAGDSRDIEGQVRFFPFIPQSHVPPHEEDKSFWYWQYIQFHHPSGVECCSDSVIAFHYVDRNLMWTLEYLIYHVHPFGIHPKLTGSHVKEKIELYLKQKAPTNITKSNVTKSTK